MRLLAICLMVVSQFALPCVGQQSAANGQTATVSCTFDDGKQMSIRYNNSDAKGDEGLRRGKLWEPGGSPMILFTQTGLTLGTSDIQEGAYSLYVIPEKQSWTLVVNRNVTAGSKYDEKQDLARAPMEIGQVETPAKQPQILFGHTAAKQCNMRLYYETTGAWVEFKEK
ncbi:MAG: DUF2911 domain-containing protein [Candidatus Sulfotelmatobacter sp.]